MSGELFRPLPVGRYVAWLARYAQTGGKITHVYDYPYERAGFLLATSDFRLGGECGSSARPILVPADVRWTGGGRGHSTLYLEGVDGPHVAGTWVPAYADPEFGAVPGYAAACLRAEEERAAHNAKMARYKAEKQARAHTSDLSAYLQRNADEEMI